MKFLMFLGALDLNTNYGCNPAYWQLMHALNDIGVELVVTTYRGSAIASPWWTSYENPLLWQGNVVAELQEFRYRIFGSQLSTTRRKQIQDPQQEQTLNLIARKAAVGLFLPTWERHLGEILEREGDVDAVLFMTVPPNQVSGLPSFLRERFGIPIIHYDGDTPASLPSNRGFPKGFNIYPGANLGEYDAVLANSIGALDELRQLGARHASAFFFGADPRIFHPVNVESQPYDVSFYGYGDAFRENAMQLALVDPSLQMPETRFVVAGSRFHIDFGKVEVLGPIQPNRISEFCARSKINLSITRTSHGSVYASSTTRIYEMAATGCCIVTTPYNGVQEWFEPGEEIFVVESTLEAVELYRWLLTHEAERNRVGAKARERVLKEHTYHHRANQLVQIVNQLYR